MSNVFISHRLSDTTEAEKLAIDLRNAGHQVWLDDWEINIGDSIVERMNEGLTGSSYLVLCYSAAGVASPWITREWASALSRQLDGKQIKILPVLLTGGAPPAILADIKYADLSREWKSGVTALLKAIR